MWVFRIWLLHIRGWQLWLFVNDVFHVCNLALIIPQPVADEITSLLQLLQRGADGIHTVLADRGKASCGVVPFVREGEHLREQPTGLAGQLDVPKVVVAHHGICL